MSEATFETSKEAYDYCMEQGLLSQRVAEVMKALVDASGPMNQTMVHQAIVRESGKVGLEKYSISPRFVVLERMGLIREAGKGACPVTKRTTIFYEPSLLKPVMSEPEAMKAAPDRKRTISELERQNKELTEENAKLRELLNMRSASHAERERRIRETPVAVQTQLFAGV